MTTLKDTIFRGWHFMRWFRLGMAVAVAYGAIDMQNIWLGLMAGLFLMQALFNTGCCGSAGACAVDRRSRNSTGGSRE